MFDRLQFLDQHESIPSLFKAMTVEFPNQQLYSQALRDPDNEAVSRKWIEQSYQQTAGKVWKLANYLADIGLSKGQAVAIVSYTRPEWLIADMAIQAIGAVSVAVYHSSSRSDTGFIIFDSGARIAFAENQEQVDKLLSLTTSHVSIPKTEAYEAHETIIGIDKIIAMEQVADHPLVVSLSDIFECPKTSDEAPSSIEALTRDTVACLVYTSGTTGVPKGVIQSHGNHIANLLQTCKTGLYNDQGSIFMFLPLAHAFARLVGYIGFLTPSTLAFPAVYESKTSVLNAESTLRDLRDGEVELFPTVPRILEKLQAAIINRTRETGLRARVLSYALSSAAAVYRARANCKTPSIREVIGYRLTGTVRKAIKKRLFGANFKHIISGGAKLQSDVAEFFLGLDIPVYEGYGLTETCVAVTANRIGKNKPGSVGLILEGVELRLAQDGEILFRGSNVAQGYYRRPIASQLAWDGDGWFHTGDIGVLDDEGFLLITSRKKELIVTAGGKKIAPTPIEDKLKESSYITEALLYGEGRPYCIVLIVLNNKRITEWFDSQGICPQEALHEASIVNDLIQEEINRVNATLSKWETIKKLRIMPNEFSVARGEITPTFKVKRDVVYSNYQQIIEDSYAKDTC